MSAQPVNPNLPPDQVTVFIDGVEMAAPKGSMIIQAADKAGIPIPRFCYHDKLSVAANCRMCLVEVEKMPKPAPACATPVMDGMKVVTRSEKALKSQRNVMEFLLINHPLDCPICDQGGECELQDLSMGYGRSISRFSERKRTVPDEDIGPLVATEMTRCIQCTRCVRFTAEVAGTYELGGMYRGENLQIGTYDGKPLTTELSGNVIDVCPVGALTNKVFQFKARPWELMARESLGYHDALGSNLFLHVRRGEVLRTVPRDNDAVNECWLSDRDRYSHQGLYAPDRATRPMVKEGGEWVETSWEQALARAAQVLRENGADDLGVLVHPATSNEEGALLARLAEALGTGNLDHRISQLDLSDAAVAEPFGMPVADVEMAGAILIVGSKRASERLGRAAPRCMSSTRSISTSRSSSPDGRSLRRRASPMRSATARCATPSWLRDPLQSSSVGSPRTGRTQRASAPRRGRLRRRPARSSAAFRRARMRSALPASACCRRRWTRVPCSSSRARPTCSTASSRAWTSPRPRRRWRP